MSARSLSNAKAAMASFASSETSASASEWFDGGLNSPPCLVGGLCGAAFLSKTG